jgi:hypothetical protein
MWNYLRGSVVIYARHSAAAGGKQLAKQVSGWEKCLKAGKRHGRIQEFGQRFLELYVKSWLFEPHTRGKFMNQVSVYKTGKC